MRELEADSPIQYLRGVGPARAGWFAQVNLHTVGDLLEHLPFRYESEQGEIEIADLAPDMVATIRGEVRRVRGRWPTFSAEVTDGTGMCWLRWFNQRYRGQGIYVGAFVVATGKAQEYRDRLEIVHPRVQVFASDKDLPPTQSGPKQIGVYRGTERLTSAVIRKAVLTLLEQPRLPVAEVLPSALRIKRSLPTRADALREVHLPGSVEAHARAHARLAYEELLLMELAVALRRQHLLGRHRGHKLALTPEIDQRIRARFPFALTEAQDRALREIARDLMSGRPMGRLLQGDVGSGKTVVALYACLMAIANGHQAAIMAPTEVLAQQHFANIERYLAGSRVRRLLLRGGLGRQDRESALQALASGAVELVVGTHALLQPDVAFNDLGLVVIDEQHKFGVAQRADARTKGVMPHYLVMTATPIPRTLAMTVFGDLDVSVIDSAPPGRGKIRTRVAGERDWLAVMTDLRRRLVAGEQAFVVCPAIGAEATDAVGDQSRQLTSVNAEYQRLVSGPWRGLELGLLHGAMSSEEKQAVTGAFADGRLSAVIATTVVEVGIDVPNATIMVVEHADRFGLSQLHQLRGRVGRGQADSECILIAYGDGKRADERLKVLVDTTDGFRVAEADLRQRGPGEMLGARQHGLPELRVANLVEDFAIVEQARQDAFGIVAEDPALQRPEHRRLLAALKRVFGEKLRFIDAA